MAEIYKYGAVGEEGCEFVADTVADVQTWIDLQIEDEDMPKDYYQIYRYTKKEFENMREV